MDNIPEMATALGSPLVWATYAIFKTQNCNKKVPAKSRKLYQGNGWEGNQCLLESPPIYIYRGSKRMIKQRLTSRVMLSWRKDPEQGWACCPYAPRAGSRSSRRRRSISETPLPHHSPDAKPAFCLHLCCNAKVSHRCPMTELAASFQGEQHLLCDYDGSCSLHQIPETIFTKGYLSIQ